MIDIESHFKAVKAAWVHRIMNANQTLWTFLGKYFFSKFGDDIIFNTTFTKESEFPALKQIPKFYREVIISYNCAKAGKTQEMSAKQFRSEIIWGNKIFTTQKGNKKQTLYVKHWIDVGLIYIKDLAFKNGELDEMYIYNKLVHRHNYFKQILYLKKALRPYKLIKKLNYTPNQNEGFKTTLIHEKLGNRAKKYYESILSNIFEKPVFLELLEEKFTVR